MCRLSASRITTIPNIRGLPGNPRPARLTDGPPVGIPTHASANLLISARERVGTEAFGVIHSPSHADVEALPLQPRSQQARSVSNEQTQQKRDVELHPSHHEEPLDSNRNCGAMLTVVKFLLVDAMCLLYVCLVMIVFLRFSFLDERRITQRFSHRGLEKISQSAICLVDVSFSSSDVVVSSSDTTVVLLLLLLLLLDGKTSGMGGRSPDELGVTARVTACALMARSFSIFSKARDSAASAFTTAFFCSRSANSPPRDCAAF